MTEKGSGVYHKQLEKRLALTDSSSRGTPQKALRGVIPASLCLVLGAIVWDFLSKVDEPA